jgi:hypothetical protein
VSHPSARAMRTLSRFCCCSRHSRTSASIRARALVAERTGGATVAPTLAGEGWGPSIETESIVHAALLSRAARRSAAAGGRRSVCSAETGLEAPRRLWPAQLWNWTGGPRPVGGAGRLNSPILQDSGQKQSRSGCARGPGRGCSRPW